MDLEKRGGAQKKRGRSGSAERLYRRAIEIESKILGKDHPHTIDLRIKLLGDSSSLRTGSVALWDSFLHEAQGDYLREIGNKESAFVVYTMCLQIERGILGKNYHDLYMILLIKKLHMVMTTNKDLYRKVSFQSPSKNEKDATRSVEQRKGLRSFTFLLKKKSVTPMAA